jgi:ribosomal protein S24E
MQLDYKMEIKSNIRNELFKRDELKLEIVAKGTPSFSEIRKQLSEKLEKPEEVIDVLSIKGSFGSSIFVIEANIYDKKEGLDESLERKKTSKKKKEDKKNQKEAQRKKDSTKESKEPGSEE